MAKKRSGRKRSYTPRVKWAQNKVEKAERELKEVQPHDPFFSRIVFWSAIFVIVLGNLLISIALIPFLAVLNRWFLDIIIVVLALVMGFLFNFLITNTGHLGRHHHILALLIIPTIAIINMVFIVVMANDLAASIQLNNVRHNPWLIGILYGVGFIVPYIFQNVRKIYK